MKFTETLAKEILKKNEWLTNVYGRCCDIYIDETITSITFTFIEFALLKQITIFNNGIVALETPNTVMVHKTEFADFDETTFEISLRDNN